MPFALVWGAHSPAPPLLGFLHVADALARRQTSRPQTRALAAA
jgi:hypothetical protein